LDAGTRLAELVRLLDRKHGTTASQGDFSASANDEFALSWRSSSIRAEAKLEEAVGWRSRPSRFDASSGPRKATSSNGPVVDRVAECDNSTALTWTGRSIFGSGLVSIPGGACSRASRRGLKSNGKGRTTA